MAPYSMDLRERVARAWDVSGDAEEVAATFGVSRAWVHRLIQRRRETGSINARPDATLGNCGRRCRPPLYRPGGVAANVLGDLANAKKTWSGDGLRTGYW